MNYADKNFFTLINDLDSLINLLHPLIRCNFILRKDFECSFFREQWINHLVAKVYLRIEPVYLRIEPFYLRIERIYLRIGPVYLRIAKSPS